MADNTDPLARGNWLSQLSDDQFLQLLQQPGALGGKRTQPQFGNYNFSDTGDTGDTGTSPTSPSIGGELGSMANDPVTKAQHVSLLQALLSGGMMGSTAGPNIGMPSGLDALLASTSPGAGQGTGTELQGVGQSAGANTGDTMNAFMPAKDSPQATSAPTSLSEMSSDSEPSGSDKYMEAVFKKLTKPDSKMGAVEQILNGIGMIGSSMGGGQNTQGAIAEKQRLQQQAEFQQTQKQKKLEMLTQLAGHAASIKAMQSYHSGLLELRAQGLDTKSSRAIMDSVDKKLNSATWQKQMADTHSWFSSATPEQKYAIAKAEAIDEYAASNPTPMSNVGGQSTAKGAKKVINGVPYTSDGTKWVKD